MSKKQVFVLGLTFIVTLAFTVWAAPGKINYQGRLTDLSGDSMDTTVQMEFSICGDSLGNACTWTEVHDSVQVSDGLFNVILGSTTPITTDNFSGSERWLGINVGGEVMPYTRLVSVPYALNASGTGWVDDGADVRLETETDSVGIGTSDPHAKLHISNTGAAHQLILESTGPGGGYWAIGQSDDGFSSGGGLLVFTPDVSGGAVHSVMALRNTGNVGIGTTNPLSGLHIRGSGYTGGSAIRIEDTTYNQEWGIASNAEGFEITEPDLASHVTIKPTTGNVGLGTQSPSEKLHVTGVVYSDSGGYRFPDNTVQTTAAVAGGNWTAIDSVVYTNAYWGIARGNAWNALYGAQVHTHVNLGVACTTGTVGGNEHYAIVSGGRYNVASADCAVVAGGNNNTAGHIYSAVSGGDRNTASGGYSTVGGGENNIASAHKSTIGGGTDNTASEYWSTVGGGIGNTASGWFSTIGGGWNNTASDSATTVGGGHNNHAQSKYSWIGGGQNNTAKGYGSAIPGGLNNLASGKFSFASGRGARAVHDGAFVLADASGGDLESTKPNQFLIRASGGMKMYSDADLTAGVTMHAGASAWATNSDRNLKDQFKPVDTRELLDRIASLPITTWNYKSQDESVRHIGPMAQDFSAAFGVGEDNTHISTVDADGVALAAIQALLEKITQLEQRITELEAQNK